jgi:hypothetical protein
MSSAGDIVFANSFSQPMVQFTSYAFPTPYAAVDSLVYDPNITKYVFYSLGPASTLAVTKLVAVTGTPLNFAQSVTISCTADYIVKNNGATSGAITTESTHIAAVSWENSSPNSAPPNVTSGEILMRMTCVAPFPAFSAGISVLKLVINITND